MANPSLRVDDIERGPELVIEGVPYVIVAVDRNRIVDSDFLRRSAYVIRVLLEGKLGRMYADHHQSLVLVFLGPCVNVRPRASPVDAGVGPEIDEDDLPAQAGRGQWR